MSEEIKLKPCPFCGGEAILVASKPGHEGRIWHIARCRDRRCIGASMNVWEYRPERAAANWNRRAEA